MDYYLNDFPKPFVVDGRPDLSVIYGRDSRDFLLSTGATHIGERKDMFFADILDAIGVTELVFIIGKESKSDIGESCAFTSGWFDNIAAVKEKSKEHNMIVIGSGKVNSVFEEYESKSKLQFRYKGDIPNAILFEDVEKYTESEHPDIGFVQIIRDSETNKYVLLMGGFHGKGTYAASIALARKLNEIKKYDNVSACVVESISTERLGYVFDDVKIIGVVSNDKFKKIKDIPSVGIKPKIFVIHGTDLDTLNFIVIFLKISGWHPVVSIYEPDGGMTLEQKVKYYLGESDYCLAIATPDDKVIANNKVEFRARQNVIFEIGLAQEILGMKKIIILKEKSVTLPTDFDGIMYISFKKDNFPEALEKLKRNLNSLHKTQ